MSKPEPTQLLVTRESRRPHDGLRSATALIPIFLGTAFLIVGVVDLVLLWIPTRMDSVAWEFATIGRTLDGFPMPALFGVLTLLLVAVAVLFATLAPAVLSQTPAEALDAARRGVIRHAVQAAVYPLTFCGLAVILWRSANR
jgi:hypothetical protein